MSIWESRKFRALVVDTVFSTAVFFITHYLAPQLQEPVLFLIASWQPVAIALIVGWAYEDGKLKGAPVTENHYHGAPLDGLTDDEIDARIGGTPAE